MARSSTITQVQAPPPDWTPTQAVDDPIVNDPYSEPDKHWIYQGAVPFLEPTRRPASYWYRTRRTAELQQELFAEEERHVLPLVNRLREDVKRWRNASYRGASPVTRDLLAWWTRDDRARRLFFCQREAVETLIYLLELAIPGRLSRTGYRNFELDAADVDRLLRGETPSFTKESDEFATRLVDPPADDALLPLLRLGCKMATGSGKTLVMAMLIAWAFCNRGRNPASSEFPNAVLVCAPNLTVRTRLQVLRPDDAKNYYDAFDLVPTKYRELMNAGQVLVTNWHSFAPKSPHKEGDATYRVVDKGEETADAFTLDRLGELAARLPILVLNDEGHHCWRPAPGTKASTRGLSRDEKAMVEEELEEARVWLAGLDRINNAGLLGPDRRCVLAAVDLSATPFYLANSGHPEGSPFPWLVNDFGLVDAIECGIVKIPRLPVADGTSATDEAGRPDPKYFRLWKHITESLQPGQRLAGGRPRPDALYTHAQGALLTLASQWKQRLEEILAASPGEAPIPPVMIVVCDNTDLAEIVFQEISGEKMVEMPSEDGRKTTQQTVYEGSKVFPELANSEGVRRTVRIDSKLLAKAEVEEGETRDQAALALREIIDTVGKRGQPGEHTRCVVSVSMLTEGWDANNVTHILGIRAFGSQLLCEQVVGRGLRRMSYTPDPETGRLPAEYVDVYGIPFSLIPFKGKPKDGPDTDPVYHHIFPLDERADFEIRIPVVEGYTYDLRDSGIRCDVDELEGFVVKDEPEKVYLQPMRGYIDGVEGVSLDDYVEQTREKFYESVRFQQIVYRLAQLITDELIQGADGEGRARKRLLARHQLFPELVLIISRYIAKRVKFAPGVDRRELALRKYVDLLRKHIVTGIMPAAADDRSPLVPIINSFKPWLSTAEVNYRTARPVVSLTKSHLNLAAYHSDWERQAIEKFEDLDCVECYTPNDRNIGLMVPYEYGESEHRYEPDFIIRLRGGTYLMLEIKGKGGEIHDENRVLIKNAAAKKWVAAINNTRRLGDWAFAICKDLEKLRATLEAHVTPSATLLPFSRIDTPVSSERYVTCVPLVSLRAAAGHWSEEQAHVEAVGEWAEEWIAYETRTRFEPGMFIARVQGRSMEPLIPDGAYCLFRPPQGGSREGRKLLVWHSGVTDPATGGQYTLKVYSSEKAIDLDTDWQHTRITLKPLNPEFNPIVLTPEDENEVRELAEFVEVVGVPTEETENDS